MAILQVRDINDRLYSTLKGLAKAEKRSISQEVIVILERYMAQPVLGRAGQTEEFLRLSGTFEDESAQDVLRTIRRARRNSRRFAA